MQRDEFRARRDEGSALPHRPRWPQSRPARAPSVGLIAAISFTLGAVSGFGAGWYLKNSKSLSPIRTLEEAEDAKRLLARIAELEEALTREQVLRKAPSTPVGAIATASPAPLPTGHPLPATPQPVQAAGQPSLQQTLEWLKSRLESEQRKITWSGCTLELETFRSGYRRYIIPLGSVDLDGTRVETRVEKSADETYREGPDWWSRDRSVGSASRQETIQTDYTLILKSLKAGGFGGLGIEESEIRLYIETETAGDSVVRAVKHAAGLCGVKKLF